MPEEQLRERLETVDEFLRSLDRADHIIANGAGTSLDEFKKRMDRIVEGNPGVFERPRWTSEFSLLWKWADERDLFGEQSIERRITFSYPWDFQDVTAYALERVMQMVIDQGLHKIFPLDSPRAFEEDEAAAKVRDQLRAIGALYSSTGDVNYFKEVEQLERVLGLPKRPERIECIDISTIMGQQS